MNVPHVLIAGPIPHFLVSCCMSATEVESHHQMDHVPHTLDQSEATSQESFHSIYDLYLYCVTRPEHPCIRVLGWAGKLDDDRVTMSQ